MKTQRALRLRQAGRHQARCLADVDWIWKFDLEHTIRHAFERNCVPKHSDEPRPTPYAIMDYVTGVTTWYGTIRWYGNA